CESVSASRPPSQIRTASIPPPVPIQKIAVLGAGQMGAGIAQVAAVAGFEVVLRDVEDRFLVNGLAAIDQGLAKAVEKGKLTEDARRTARGRIRPTTRLDDVAHRSEERRVGKEGRWRWEAQHEKR